MKKLTLIFSYLVFILFSLNTYAGKDPIGWSISPATGFSAATKVGNSYAVSYTMSNNLPFAVPLTVSSAYTGGSFTITNGCNKTLPVGGTCLVHVMFQPIKAGQSTVRLTLAYHNNRVPLPTLSSVASSGQTAQKIDGFVTTPLPAVTYTGTTYPLGFTFINNGTATVTASAVNVSGFTATGNTCLSALTPHSTCAVTGNYSPVAAGQATLGVTYVYSNGSVPLTTQTNTQTNSGACHAVNGFAALPLPVSTYIYADNVVQYTFTNHCDSSTETLGTVTLSADGGSPTITKGADNCSGSTLAANASCSVYASVVPNNTTGESDDLSVTAAIPYSGGTLIASSTTSEIVNALSNQATTHTVNFVNQCDQTVWYEFQNGAGGTKSPDPTPNQPTAISNYQINPQLPGAAPSTLTLSVNEYINGAIYGRTGCSDTTGVCATGNCAPITPGSGTCTKSTGATNPVTIFETNMAAATASDGVYDLSIINGFNLPGEVRSLAPISSNPFGCGQSGGAIIQPAGSLLAMCPWTFTPPSTVSPDTIENYYWVSAGVNDDCASSTSCTAGEYCGMGFSTDGGSVNRRCGTFLGYWTIADYTGFSSTSQWGSTTYNLYTAYSLGISLPAHVVTGGSLPYGSVPAVNPTGPATYGSMYGCVPTNNGSLLSGYGNGTPPSPLPNTNVCGCYDWNQAGSVALTTQASNCTATNSDWTTTVFGRISWLKQACPTAYSFQFDDKSTQFTCNVTAQKTSYQITYCPGGKTGRPSA